MIELLKPLRGKIGSSLTAETMGMLSSEELTLLAYFIFRSEMLSGGMVQLVHNGYGPFIFENPFAKAMRLWGLKDFSKFIYSMRQEYEKSGEALAKDCTEDEFMALYEQYPELDDFDDLFIDIEPEITKTVCDYFEAYKNQIKE